jgi:DNA repair and recombination RAD54-like protein
MTGDVGKLLTEGPGLLILDEGHLVRTKNTKILTSLMQVRTERRVLLSGTPFNNNSNEFYHTPIEEMNVTHCRGTDTKLF